MTSNEEPLKKKKKRADTDGWRPATLDKRLKDMNKNKHAGDWWRDTVVHNLRYKVATVKWTNKQSKKMFTFESPVPVGMEEVLQKLETAQNRSFEAIPVAVREEFSMLESTYKSIDYEVSVSFSSSKYANFRLLYCRLWTSRKNLKERFWDKYPDKLPKENICREELMKNWDSLDLSWNSQDVLGCILPNNPKQFALINARRFIQRPILHWETVHEVCKKPQKGQITLSFGEKSVSTVPTTASSTKSYSDKSGHRHSQLRQTSVDDIIDPRINFKVRNSCFRSGFMTHLIRLSFRRWL